MSSVFQKPLPDSSRNKFLLILVPVFFFLLPDVSGYRFGLLPPDDATEFTFVGESDYDELLVRLSLYAFTQLSPGDQLEQVEIVHNIVKSEDVELQGAEENDEAFRLRTFAELFKKLPYSDQLKLFLSKVIQKFKRERMSGELTVLFEHLDAKHQQRLIEKIVPVTPENILQKPGETEEDFRQRRFTQLSEDYTDYVYKRTLDFWEDTMKSEDKMEKISYDENNSDWMSSFTDFFSGFFIIWFQGQSPRGQDLLIEQILFYQQGCGVIKNPPHNDTEEGFRLRRFTEICKNVVDFKVQDKLLYHAEYKLERWGVSSHARLTCEPQESDRDADLRLLHSRLSTSGFSLLSSQNQQKTIDEMSAEVDRIVIERYAAAPALLSRLWTFGFGLFSSQYQQQKIDEMSNQEDRVVIERYAAAPALPAAEDIRIRRFTELLDQVSPFTREKLLRKFKSFFTMERGNDYLSRLFKQLSSKDQTEVVDKLFNDIIRYRWSGDSVKLIIEKLPGESEEGLRLRRFQKILMEHFSDAIHLFRLEVEERLKKGTILYLPEEREDNSNYAEFLLGVSIIWFKRCASHQRRNPIQLILFGEVEFSDKIEKLPEESDEDFRLRRFTESFKQLPLALQERIFDFIEQYVVPFQRCSSSGLFEGSGAFDSSFFKVKHPNLKDQGAAATQGAGVAAVGGQWTFQIGG